jgi:aminopeptidase N
MGAMENKGLNVFNDKYVLASPSTATDMDFAHIEAIIAHEYFHNWTGNRITCRDWFQLCLKEGLTVYRDQEFTADHRTRAVERISDVRALRMHQFVEDAGPLAHPVRPETYREINNFYTTTVYEKGAEVVRMLRVLLGPETFRAGMDLYFARHDGEAATVEQFIACFADASKHDLTQFMRWYTQAGTPEIVATVTHDARARTCRLELAQTIPPTPGQVAKEPMVIPLAIGLVDREGRDLRLTLAEGTSVERGVLTLTKSAETFVFRDITEAPVPSLNRGFSAPVKLNTNLSHDDYRFLAARDPDPFNRWQALQTLATRLLLDNAAALRANEKPRSDHGLLEALTAIIADRSLEPAFVALALAMPSETDIARDIGRDVDPDTIFSARFALRAEIGRQLAPALARTYETMLVPGPYRPDAESSGRRSLRNACLDLLVTAHDDGAITRAMLQYEGSDNMTDRMAALATLSLCDVPERKTALNDFYTRYHDDPLIVDKWFGLQAFIPEPGTLDRVKALTKHPAFSPANPNRVRALIGSFTVGNQTQFNRADGAGYDFTVDNVLSLDAGNPQLAARLLSSLKSWRALEPVRRARAQAALQRVAAAPSLSRDVNDIVQRALAAD